MRALLSPFQIILWCFLRVGVAERPIKADLLLTRITHSHRVWGGTVQFPLKHNTVCIQTYLSPHLLNTYYTYVLTYLPFMRGLEYLPV